MGAGHASRLSPDGHWIAYASNETGRLEIYVQPFPSLEGKWQISTDGGGHPVWARNGQELFYRSGDKDDGCGSIHTAGLVRWRSRNPL